MSDETNNETLDQTSHQEINDLSVEQALELSIKELNLEEIRKLLVGRYESDKEEHVDFLNFAKEILNTTDFADEAIKEEVQQDVLERESFVEEIDAKLKRLKNSKKFKKLEQDVKNSIREEFHEDDIKALPNSILRFKIVDDIIKTHLDIYETFVEGTPLESPLPEEVKVDENT